MCQQLLVNSQNSPSLQRLYLLQRGSMLAAPRAPWLRMSELM